MRNILFFACFPLIICSQQTESLKEKFEDYFLIGATINQEDYQIIDRDHGVLEIVKENFNSVTPENSMKWMHSHPEYYTYTFSNAEKIAQDDNLLAIMTIHFPMEYGPGWTKPRDGTSGDFR